MPPWVPAVEVPKVPRFSMRPMAALAVVPALVAVVLVRVLLVLVVVAVRVLLVAVAVAEPGPVLAMQPRLWTPLRSSQAVVAVAGVVPPVAVLAVRVPAPVEAGAPQFP